MRYRLTRRRARGHLATAALVALALEGWAPGALAAGPAAVCPQPTGSACASAGHHGQALPTGRPSLAVASSAEFADLAHGFMAGCSEGGAGWSTNSAPAAWCKAHVQLEVEGVDLFHHDAERTAGTGRDHVPPHGIDSAPLLFFLATHGGPAGWDAPNGKLVELRFHPRIGDDATRYLWLCSCEVMAHGPPDADGRYVAPVRFAGGPDVAGAGRNVYARWAGVIAPQLRMVCGGVGKVCGNPRELTDRIWDYHANRGRQVADAFVGGLLDSNSGVAMCMTRGGSEVASTPLGDTAFSPEGNPAAAVPDSDAWIYLLYPEVVTEPAAREADLPPRDEPYPLYRYTPSVATAGCASGAEPRGELCVRQLETGLEERVDRRSGAVYLSGGALAPPVPFGAAFAADSPGAAAGFLEQATRLAESRGWLVPSHRPPRTSRLVIERSRVADKGSRPERFQKHVGVRFRRQIAVARPDGPELVPVFGAGGEVDVVLGNDGSLVSAARVWRPADAGTGMPVAGVVVDQVPVRSPAVALAALLDRDDSRRRLSAYRTDPSSFEWGYQEEAGNCRQKVMRIVYQFTFPPLPEAAGLPPLTLSVPGQVLSAAEEADLRASPCYGD